MLQDSGTRLWLKYFLLAVLAWLVVDYTTTPAIGDPHGYYSKYMPALLLFYFGYPLTFAVLRYRLRWGMAGLFVAMLVGIVVVEILFTQNALMYTLPICLLAIPISLGHYAMVTFMPLWLAEGTIFRHKKLAAATLAVWAVGVFLNVLTQFGSHS